MQHLDNNQEDLKKMQQEAIRRVREMQSKAKRNIYSSAQPNSNNNPSNLHHSNKTINNLNNNNHIANMQSNEVHNLHNQQPEQNNSKKRVRKLKLKKSFGLENVFDMLTKDSEKSIILLLIVILMEEECDNMLILCLIYLLI